MFDNDQQKANEKIYLMTLKQQEKLENEKIKERNRISEELHDGVLGKLFGTRMNLGFLAIDGDKKTLKQHRFYLDELQTIEIFIVSILALKLATCPVCKVSTL